MKKRFVIILLSLAVVGCSGHFASNDKQQYLRSKNGPDLVVPAPLTKENLSYFYYLPAQNNNADVSIRPQ